MLNVAVARANARLRKHGPPPLPDPLAPYSVRRTFCSLLDVLSEDPGLVMDEMGHTDPAVALRVYRQVMRRCDAEKAVLVDGAGLASAAEEPQHPLTP